MKKNVLMKSKRMAAFALSLSMVLAEGSVAGATELNANPNPDSAVVTEADTEATEVDVQETETPAADQATETASTEEASQQDAPEESPEQVMQEETAPVAEEAAQENVTLEEETNELATKITTNTTLSDVTGLAFDAAKGRLTWNKVPGATKYKITIYTTNAAGQLQQQDSETAYGVYYNLRYYISEEKDYTVGVRAYNDEELYVSETNISTADMWKEDEQGNYVHPRDQYVSSSVTTSEGTSTVYTLYRYPASANEATIAVRIPSAKNAITALTAIKFKEIRNGSAVFTVAPDALQSGEVMKYEYANNASFKGNGGDLYVSSGETDTNITSDINIPLNSFNPGDRIYIRARVYNENYAAATKDDEKYSAYVTAQYTVPKADVENVNVTVTSSSVRLVPSVENGNVTGYQYQRKNGKKWMNLGKTKDNFTDKGLKKDTKYTYRVRGYSYNKATKKTVYTDWAKVSAYTWGSSLNVKAAAASSNSVKLTWDKVSSASGYEIYRCENCSAPYNFNGHDRAGNLQSSEEFCNLKLIKTIKKSKTVSCKDTKLSTDERYHYVVRAYRNVGKTKNYIEGTAEITLNKKAHLSDVTKYYNTKGQYVVSWSKMTGISGYKVEKQNPATGKYVSYKTLSKTKTSITLPAVKPGEDNVDYRIAPYSGSKVYDNIYVTVEPRLGVVKNVKAVKTAEGVKVTWSAVANADYYKVYRATQDAVSYDKKTKTYKKPADAELVYETNYDVSESSNLALLKQSTVEMSGSERVNLLDSQVTVDEDGDAWFTDANGGTHYVNGSSGSYYYYAMVTKNVTLYEYDANLRTTGNELYKSQGSYRNEKITGTSVVDKTAAVQSLILKSDDPAYNPATDPEYFAVDEWSGSYGEYVKNADGSLATELVTKYEGPEAGNTYFYFVEAVAKASNGANGNSNETTSEVYTKGAKVTYTNVSAKATKVKSVKSSKKAQATITINKVSGASGYAIYRSTKKNGTYDQIGTTTGKTFTDTNVTSGKTYYYKVASYKASENGTYVYSKLSSAKKIKVK